MAIARTIDTAERDLEDEDDELPKADSRQRKRAQTRDDQKLLKRALDRFKQANHDQERRQRERETDDLEFDAGNHWPKDLLEQRAERMSPTGEKIPAQPTLTIPRLVGPVQQVINQQAKASLAIKVKPKGLGATQKTAEYINGLIRHIQVESRAQIARGWAYNRAVKCGRGYYRILKEYANDGDFDMDIVVARIKNQSSVYLDPFHTQPDASDIEWAFLVEDIPAARFKREHGKSRVLSMASNEGFDDTMKDWVTLEGSEIKTVRRAEHWYVTYVDKQLIQTADGYRGFESDRPAEDTSEVEHRRPVRQRKVRWVKMTCGEILEREEWEGRYIPLVQVLGREYNINGKSLYKGMIADAKDAQRSYNYMRSKQVAAVGLAPVAPYTMVEGQDEGYEDMWANANTVAYSRLLYKPISIAGQPAPPPQRTSASTDISAITMAAHAAAEDMDSITGFSDPSRGRSNPADRSGRAITALQNRTDEGVSDFLDGLTQVSMVHEGRIILDLLPFIYDTEGRIATVLDEDLQTSHTVMLNKPFIPPTGPHEEPTETDEDDPDAVLIDLKKGVFRVVVDVGKSFKTQRDEAVGMLGELIAAAPQTASLVTDVLVENIDAPGFTKLARRFRAVLPPNIQKMEAGDAPLPPAAQAQVSMLEQQLQQQGQAMQQMQQALEQKKVETDAKAAIEQSRLELQRELELAKLAMQERLEMRKIEAGMQTKTLESESSLQQEELKAVARRVGQEADLRHDAISQDTQLAHDRAQAELKANVEREKIRATKRGE